GWILHLPDRHRRWTGTGSRSLRLQAGHRRGNRRLRGHLLGIPLAGASARRLERKAVRATATHDLSLEPRMNASPAGASQASRARDFDLSRAEVSRETALRELNQWLHQDFRATAAQPARVLHPDGAHSIAVGVDAPLTIDVLGHAGYYVAGMNKQAHITVHGNAGTGAAENMMSGLVRIKGFASNSAGAS